MEKDNQPWSLSMLAIAKAAFTPSNDFILLGMNKLNEYVPSAQLCHFTSSKWGVCVCVLELAHTDAYFSPHTDSVCR